MVFRRFWYPLHHLVSGHFQGFCYGAACTTCPLSLNEALLTLVWHLCHDWAVAKDLFLKHLKQEFERKKEANRRYSLRSFAKFLDINHATLSGLLSGKRAMSEKLQTHLAKKIDPDNVYGFYTLAEQKSADHLVLDQQTFSQISEWYFDAIIELVKIKKRPWSNEKAAEYLGLATQTVESAVNKLIDIGLLETVADQLVVKHEFTTNLESNEQTSEMMRRYQKSILELSISALGNIDRKWRDHQSTMLAVNKNDISKVKEIIKKFSFEISSYLQDGKKSEFDEIYQLAISFFPLNQMESSGLKAVTQGERK